MRSAAGTDRRAPRSIRSAEIPCRMARHWFSSSIRPACSSAGSPSSMPAQGAGRHQVAERSDRDRLAHVGRPVGVAQLDRAERLVGSHAPPDLRVLADRPRIQQEPDEGVVLAPACERLRDAAAREHAREVLGARRVQEGLAPFRPGRARAQREQIGQDRAQAVHQLDRAVAALHADVDVDAERVVAPRHVAQGLLDELVVRRVDDRLIRPARPRVRAGRAQLDAQTIRDARRAADGVRASGAQPPRTSRTDPS